MIFEAIQHFITPAPQDVKALGYVREAIAIEARHNRCRLAWAPHLEHCRREILTAATPLDMGSTIMIIGSGALHDVPMEALLMRGHSLILVDIFHFSKVRKRYKNHGRITFIEQDITGQVLPLFRKQIPQIEKKPDLPKADLAISLNILSQLPLNLVKYALKHLIPLPENYASAVMEGHLTSLHQAAPRTLVISDIARAYHTGTDSIEKEPALPDALLGQLHAPDQTWDWDIAPKGEWDKNIALVHHIACWKYNDIDVS